MSENHKRKDVAFNGTFVYTIIGIGFGFPSKA